MGGDCLELFGEDDGKQIRIEDVYVHSYDTGTQQDGVIIIKNSNHILVFVSLLPVCECVIEPFVVDHFLFAFFFADPPTIAFCC